MSSSNKQGLEITHVLAGSLADRNGIQPGDRLLRVNEHRIGDSIDYRFFGAEEEVRLEVARREVRRVVTVTKGMDENLGLELSDPPFKTCRNNCIFCFVHQMPRGLRKSLYVKDDDYRLSFLYGNYITLTNFTESDFERIFQQHLSPLYVSVQATDDKVRKMMLGNPEAPPVLPAIKHLVSGGIGLHAQIVLCPGINDGRILDRTVKDLAMIRPGVESVAVVPAGLTGHRKRLYPLSRIDKEYAERLLDQVQNMQKQYHTGSEGLWIFASDEFYRVAQRSFPPLEAYGTLPQLENGVGMVALFVEGVMRGVDQLKRVGAKKTLSIGTGVLAFPVLKSLMGKIEAQTGCHLELVPIQNRFFGDSVTIAGLITGSDLIHAFSKKSLRGSIFLPASMLKQGEEIFLDGLTVQDVEGRLGHRLCFVEENAEGFLSIFQDAKII